MLTRDAYGALARDRAYKCELVVAIVVGNVADEQERKAAHHFLESNTVQVWVNQQLEGR
jgi:hypothetical protein